MSELDPFLRELADMCGVATEYLDWKCRNVPVPAETITAILAALDIDASTPERAQQAAADIRLRPWRQALPTCVVMEQGTSRIIDVHVRSGRPARVQVRLEDGSSRDVVQVDNWEPDRWIDGVFTGEASFDIPGDLPLGYHRLSLFDGESTTESTLCVVPGFLGFPKSMGNRRVWGYGIQLYSVRSRQSWGVGDLGDLRDVAIWSATQQHADFVLVNPLHAAEPMPPLEPSPYYPSSRRYANPIYIRPEDVPEFAFLPEPERAHIMRLHEQLHTELRSETRIDRDCSWVAKLEALRVLFESGMSPVRLMSFTEYCRNEGELLDQFATWSALSTVHGTDWTVWPAALQRPSSPATLEFAERHSEQIRFFKWLQWIAEEQLRLAQSAAEANGMRIGIMNDQAVGVGLRSAEAWSLGNTFARGVNVGAPPDHFNQTGQNWGQIPWRPDRLEELAYTPLRTILAGVLRHAGGIRIDHVMGLFRLWWIPEGKSALEGTYVRYNYRAMVGIVALEAYRAGALVVGEDLGLVEPGVRDYLRGRGILGTSIAWFEKDHQLQPLAPELWREYCLASVTTHDLPPTAGYLAGNHIRLQHSLGLLTESLETELAQADHDLQQWLTALRERGFLAPGVDDAEQIVLAMHRYLTATPAKVLCATLTDAVGDGLTQNQPGTIDEYPNWRVPLSHPDGTPMYLEEVFTDARAQRLADVMNQTPVRQG